MNRMPSFPLIQIGRDALTTVLPQPDPSTSLQALLRYRPADFIYFDRNGHLWTLSLSCSLYRPTLLNRLLAVFYNPDIPVCRHWQEEGRYDLQDLKDQLAHCIDRDDDFLTQYIAPSDLKDRLYDCHDFDAIITLLFSQEHQGFQLISKAG